MMQIEAGSAQQSRTFPAWIWWAVIALGVVIIGFFLFFWRTTLSLSVTPPTATITVGNSSGVGTLHETVMPGLYHVRVEASGYIPYVRDLTLARHETKQLDLQLRAAPSVSKLTDGPVQFLALDQKRESLLYLLPSSHRIERLFANDLAKPISDAITPDRFGGVSELIWSPDRQLAFYREGSNLKQYDFKRYDLVNQTVTDWPAEVHAIDWRPDGEKVAYVNVNQNTGEHTLIRADKGNENPERIFNFGETAITDPQIQWSPDGKTIAVVEHNLFLLDVFSATLKPLDVGSPVRDVVWAPGSDRLLYETEAGTLGTVKAGGTKDSTDLPGPIDRAVFTATGDALITASGRGATLAINRYDLTTGAFTSYGIAPGLDLNPSNLLIGKDDATLFFTSAGALYALPLDDGSYE